MSFQTSKSILIQTLLLTIMNPMKGHVILCTDTNHLAIGAVLMQDKKILPMNLVS